MISVKGDFEAVDDYAARLESLHKAFPKAAKKVAARSQQELRAGFFDKKDPYGSAWAPQKHAYGNPLMVRSKALFGSITAAARGLDVVMRFGTGYGIYHQGGTRKRKMAQRMVIPDQGRGWPPQWIPWIKATIREVLLSYLNG